MKILLVDEEDILSAYEVIGVDNGVTSIEFDGIGEYGEEVEVPNVVRFTTSNDEYIYLFVNKNQGNDIVKHLFENNEAMFYNEKGMVLFFPYNEEDKEELDRILKEYKQLNPYWKSESNYW